MPSWEDTGRQPHIENQELAHTNFERLYGSVPAPLDQEKAVAELERMAVLLDAQGDGQVVENHARQVTRELGM
jgi:hypothetical protein